MSGEIAAQKMLGAKEITRGDAFCERERGRKEGGRRSERTNAVKERNNGGRICRHKPNLQNPDTSGGLTEIHLRSKLRESAHVSSLFD